MQLLRKLKKKLLSRQRGKQQKTTTKTKPNWLKEGDSTTGVSLFSPLVRTGMFIVVRTDREVLALFHPP